MSMVDHGFEPRSGQTKDYKIGIFLLLCYKAYSFKEWEQRLGWHRIKIICPSDMSTHELLFQWASTIKIQLLV